MNIKNNIETLQSNTFMLENKQLDINKPGHPGGLGGVKVTCVEMTV